MGLQTVLEQGAQLLMGGVQLAAGARRSIIVIYIYICCVSLSRTKHYTKNIPVPLWSRFFLVLFFHIMSVIWGVDDRFISFIVTVIFIQVDIQCYSISVL